MTSVPADQIKLAHTSLGQPYLCPSHNRSDLRFSISHTRGFGAVAISSKPVGIDIERRRNIDAPLTAISKMFGANSADRLSKYDTAAQNDIFLKLWTTAEAFGKAKGVGLAGVQSELSVFIDGSGRPNLASKRLPIRNVLQIEADHYVGAIVGEALVAASAPTGVKATSLDHLRSGDLMWPSQS